MTVASLWKALDRAECGKAVGIQELLQHHNDGRQEQRLHPWNINTSSNKNTKRKVTLAIDLSIWICEALSSTAMARSHKDPPLYLVYTRVMKLLNLGIQMVVVIEGSTRSGCVSDSTNGLHHHHRRRRRNKGGSTRGFWNACQRCEEMLGLLGVPVVRAKAEGEALCALLSQQGIVDGVISNDGDCLLYGAKVLYTKFSLENLEKSQVMRYDISNIRACVDDDDGDVYDKKETGNESSSRDIVNLNRNDMIAFAILTGSDAAGQGLPKVGCRKAIRFIKKCQLDNPLKRQDAAINELKAWADSARVREGIVVAHDHDDDGDEAITETDPREACKQKCSCCGHPGTKASHKKHGCTLCGTEAGDACFMVSPGGKFRSSLRTKALGMSTGDFDPEKVLELYHHPNDNQIPLQLHGKTSQSLQMGYPKLNELLRCPHIIRGHSFAESREYIQHSVSCLLARTELLGSEMANDEKCPSRRLPANRTRPQPNYISRAMISRGKPCFEVNWIVQATVTDSQGNPMDEFEFSTIEEQASIKKCYPKMTADFEEKEKEKQRQGTGEQEKRQAFLNLLCGGRARPVADPNDETKPKTDRRKVAARNFREGGNFGQACCLRNKEPQEHDDTELASKLPLGLEIVCSNDHRPAQLHQCRVPRLSSMGDDADKLLRFVGQKRDVPRQDDLSCSINTKSVMCTMTPARNFESTAINSEYAQSLTPSHLHFLGGSHNSENNGCILHPDCKELGTKKTASASREHDLYPVEHKPRFKPHDLSFQRSKPDPRPPRTSELTFLDEMDPSFLHPGRKKRRREEFRQRPERHDHVLFENGDEHMFCRTQQSAGVLNTSNIGLSEREVDTLRYEFSQFDTKMKSTGANTCTMLPRYYEETKRGFELFETKVQGKDKRFNAGPLQGWTEQHLESYDFRDDQDSPRGRFSISCYSHASTFRNDSEVDQLLKKWEEEDAMNFGHRRREAEVSSGLLHTATEKLETKIRQASLDFECCQQLGHDGFYY
eukprot:scaffold6440_cov124-Cylindrotheca_fusiformis.AAC.11